MSLLLWLYCVFFLSHWDPEKHISNMFSNVPEKLGHERWCRNSTKVWWPVELALGQAYFMMLDRCYFFSIPLSMNLWNIWGEESNGLGQINYSSLIVGPAASVSASPGNLLEIQILRTHPDLLTVRPSNLCFHRPSGDSHYIFENYWGKLSLCPIYH